MSERYVIVEAIPGFVTTVKASGRPRCHRLHVTVGTIAIEDTATSHPTPTNQPTSVNVSHKLRQIKDAIDLTITSLANTMQEEFSNLHIHPSATTRIANFTSAARKRLLNKSIQAPSDHDFLTGQELAVTLIEEALTTLLTEDTHSRPPLFRLLPAEKPANLIRTVLTNSTVSTASPYDRQHDLLEHANSRLQQMIVDIAQRATLAQDERQLDQERTAKLAHSLSHRIPNRTPYVPDRNPRTRSRDHAPLTTTNHPTNATEPAGAAEHPWCLAWKSTGKKCARGACEGAPCNHHVPVPLEKEMVKFFRAGGRATNVATRPRH
jgi:hypothetical protein